MSRLVKSLKSIGIAIFMGVVILLVLAMLPIILVVMVISHLHWSISLNKALRIFYQTHEGNYFFLMSKSRRKQQMLKERVLPHISQPLQLGWFDGTNYHDAVPQTLVGILEVPTNSGFPIIGKCENQKVSWVSLKAEYVKWVEKEKQVEVFTHHVQKSLNKL